MLERSSINPLSCCSYILCRRNDQFNPVPLNDLDANSEQVKLDTSSMGQQAVVVKNGKRICGSGAALGNCYINQNKAYFEVKIQSSGTWGFGLATPKINLDKIPLGTDKESWVLRDNSTVWHNNEQIVKIDKLMVQEGDIIGVSYDHVELCFLINGKHSGLSIRGMRGVLYPTVYVDDGAILDIEFTHFRHEPPHGFSEIQFEKQLF